MNPIELDTLVPDFFAQATRLKDVKLSALRGWNVVLFFYPKDHTPGCTTEASDFRDSYEEFKQAKTVIFGISRDTLRSHEQFKEDLQLPFELITDSDGSLCHLFDVIRPQNLLGKQVMSVERSTFLIDQDGILRQEWRKVKVAEHVDEVLDAAQALRRSSERS